MDRNSQLLKGVLDMCLLALIAEEPSYGYEMVDKLETRGLELVSEGSITPPSVGSRRRGSSMGTSSRPTAAARLASTTGSKTPAWVDSKSGGRRGIG